jgi:ComF family protein
MLSISNILDIFFPPFCASCRAKGSWWCSDCRSIIESLASDPCTHCLNSHADHVCNGALPFAGVVATGYYHTPQLRTFIAALKYQGVTAGANELESYLAAWKDKRSTALPWANEQELALVPMPITSSRERDRGFNQSEWIAERLAHSIAPNAPIIRAIARVSSSTPQATIEDHNLRRENVRGGFVSIASTPKAVILVDDVITTGATTREAAHALIRAGAERVYVFALALGK